MDNTSHQLFSLYEREDSPNIYAQFWDEKTQTYSSGRSTGETNRVKARNIAQSWLSKYNGPPPRTTKKKVVSKDTFIASMLEFIKSNMSLEEDQILSTDEMLSKVSVLLTGADFNKDNPKLVDYLLQFWDWDKSEYIKDKIQSGLTIGETYCKTNLSYIKTHAVPFFKDIRVKSVTTYLMEQFKNSIQRKTETTKGLGPKSINAIVLCINTALNEAKRLGIIIENPASKMRKLALNEVIREILTSEEILKLFSITWSDPRGKVAAQLAVCHGLREGEIGALCIQDIDIEKKEIVVRHSWERSLRTLKSTKNGKTRCIPTNDLIINALIDLYKMNPYQNNFIFWNLNKSDEPINIENFRYQLQDSLNSIGINSSEQKRRNLTFHSLRHFANSIIRGSIPDFVLGETMGHQTSKMTQHYSHLTEENNKAYTQSVALHILPNAFPDIV